MPALSYIHQLFSADTCQTYLRTLRWKSEHFNVLVVRAMPLVSGARTTIDQG